MRYRLLVLACLLLELACVRRNPTPQFRLLTGTCEGACEYYAACKQSGGVYTSPQSRAACVQECHEVFGSEDAIMEFETLLCEDAIAFVEGPNGRGPGEAAKDSGAKAESITK